MSSPLFSLALVTGASSGIGKALCHLLSEKGIPLLIVGRSSQRLQHLVNLLTKGSSVEWIACDLSSREDQERLMGIIRERTPDLVINNAGFGLYGEALRYSLEEQMEIFEVNARAAIAITLEAARALKERNRQGVVLNVSSVASFHCFPSFTLYTASKACIYQFSTSFDEEMRSYGIRILTASPGMVATRFSKRASGNLPQKHVYGVMSSEFAAQAIWKQITKRKKHCTFDWRYRILSWLALHCLPDRWMAALLRRSVEKRIQ